MDKKLEFPIRIIHVEHAHEELPTVLVTIKCRSVEELQAIAVGYFCTYSYAISTIHDSSGDIGADIAKMIAKLLDDKYLNYVYAAFRVYLPEECEHTIIQEKPTSDLIRSVLSKMQSIAIRSQLLSGMRNVSRSKPTCQNF